MDRNGGSYTEDGQYTGTLVPWEYIGDRSRLTVDVPTLRRAIKKIPNLGTRAVCEMHLSNLLALFEKDKIVREQERIARLVDSAPGIEVFEASLAAFETKHDLAALHAIETEEEALTSDTRKAANVDRGELRNALTRLQEETTVTPAEYESLYNKYLTLARAVGTINRGKVDHTR